MYLRKFDALLLLSACLPRGDALGSGLRGSRALLALHDFHLLQTLTTHRARWLYLVFLLLFFFLLLLFLLHILLVVHLVVHLFLRLWRTDALRGDESRWGGFSRPVCGLALRSFLEGQHN